MFSARRRRARATPAAAIPRRPKPQPPSFRLPAEVSPPGLGGGSRRPGLPSQPAWAAGEGGCVVWWWWGGDSLSSVHKMEGGSAAGDLLRQEPAPWRPLPPPLRRRRPRLASLRLASPARPHGGGERGGGGGEEARGRPGPARPAPPPGAGGDDDDGEGALSRGLRAAAGTGGRCLREGAAPLAGPWACACRP